jgi:hypothetical protein
LACLAVDFSLSWRKVVARLRKELVELLLASQRTIPPGESCYLVASVRELAPQPSVLVDDEVAIATL